MSFFGEIGNLFGGGNQNANYSAQGTNLQQVVTPDQIAAGYNNAQTGLGAQEQLNQMLAAQNGIGNQSNVYNQQQALANALMAQSQGQGPNPAQAALNQNTGNNIAAQAALAAGQRGAGANVGLLARQIGLQGAGIQQNAVGQSAIMQAQQQLAAQQQLQQQQANLANLATTQVAQQQTGVANQGQNALNEQQIINNAAQGFNNSNVAMQSNINNANQAMAAVNANNSAKLVTGLIGGAGGAGQSAAGQSAAGAGGGGAGAGGAGAAAAAAAHGGMINPKMDGEIPEHLQSVYAIYHGGSKMAFGGMSKGGPVPIMVSPGEKYMSPEQVKQFAAGDKDAVKKAEKIPGKAKVSGDSLKNDTVKKNLSPGGVVIPRTDVQSGNEKDFVSSLLNKYSEKEMGGGEDEFKEALKKAISSRRKK